MNLKQKLNIGRPLVAHADYAKYIYIRRVILNLMFNVISPVKTLMRNALIIDY